MCAVTKMCGALSTIVHECDRQLDRQTELP